MGESLGGRGSGWVSEFHTLHVLFIKYNNNRHTLVDILPPSTL